MIRSIICFLIVFCFSGFIFSQFPSWMPKEFRNKVFCGIEKDVSGKMPYGGQTTWCDVEYEMIVAEGGFQVKFNPGVKFGDNRWGETIKVKYNIIRVEKTRYGIDYVINLNSINETDDSPLKPKYELKDLYFHISTYDGSKPTSRDELRNWIEPSPTHFSCEVSVPYYSDAWFTSKDSYECRKLKSSEDILVEKLEIERKQKADNVTFSEVKQFLKVDDLINANLKLKEINFQFNNITFEQLKSEIQNKEKIRFTKIDDLAKNQKFKEALELYNSLLNPGDYNFEKQIWLKIEEKILIENYRTLNEDFKTKNLKDFIQEFLEENNKSRIEDLNDFELKEFISKNKENLSKLAVGKYNVKISNDGKILFNEVVQIENYSIVKKNVILYDEFKVDINSQFLLNITEDTSQPLYTNSKKWVLNDKYRNKIIFSKKPFTINNNNDLSSLNDLKSLIYIEQDQVNDISGDKFYFSSSDIIDFQKDFNQKKVGLYIPKSITKSVNDINLSSTLDYQFYRYIKLKNVRFTKKKIKKVFIISGVIYSTSWLIMRIIERHSANQY